MQPQSAACGGVRTIIVLIRVLSSVEVRARIVHVLVVVVAAAIVVVADVDDGVFVLLLGGGCG